MFSLLPFFFKERKSQLFLIKNGNTQSKGGDAGDSGTESGSGAAGETGGDADVGSDPESVGETP
jgi:hypothetical protein